MRLLINLLPAAFLCFGWNAYADQCPTQTLEDTIAAVSSASSCYQAVQLARDCSWQTTADTQIVAAASQICLSGQESWSFKHRFILETLHSDCDKKYEETGGSAALSYTAHCKLNVTEILWSINRKPGQ